MVPYLHMSFDERCMALALKEAQCGYAEGGVPVGAVLAIGGDIVGRGHNRRVQRGDPTAHGEIDCLRDAGRRASYGKATLYTTLSPCMLCTGAILQFKIRRVVIGEARNFAGNIDLLRQAGIDVVVLDDSPCIELMRRFIRENPSLWAEDIAE